MPPETDKEDTLQTLRVLGIEEPKALLSRFPLFRGLPEGVLDAVAAELEWLSMPGGARLFACGEPSDAAYLVVSGSLAVLDRADRVIARIGAGGTAGEMGLISGSGRTTTVATLRDCELVRIPREAFERVLLGHPQALLRLARLAVERLEGQRTTPRADPLPRTFTLVPATASVDIGRLATDLTEALSRLGRCELVWSVRGRTHSSQWFHRVESRNDFVVYAGETGNAPWTRLCVRQADVVLVAARPDDLPERWPAAADPARPGACDWVLLHEAGFVPGAAARCEAIRPDTPVHHVRGRSDVARIARLLTGRGVGLVLSGGGARGFAHIGVIRALREAGVPVDRVGGTSMGAIMGAGITLGWSVEEMTERFRRSFVDSNPLSDYTIPLFSLVSGRKVVRLLRREFGSVAIEDLPLPYFCVSTDLTTGRLATHRRGPLWQWLRASIAIPGVLPPVFLGGHVYVDGGAMNNLPVDVMRCLGNGPVVGVDVGADEAFTSRDEAVELPRPWEVGRWLESLRGRPRILQILWRAGMINSAAATALQREQSDLLLSPEMNGLDLLDWRSFDRAIELGYRHTLDALESAPVQLFA